ncbi:GNAT family N-acetyltransferase [Devosia limi]|nr:GNAT family N-acetyltransferase [Devosia limi]
MNDAIQQYELDLLGYPMREPADISASYLAGMVERVATRDGEMLVCVAGGQPVGFACGYRATDDDNLVDAAFNQFALLADLFVDPAYRAQGIAQALLDTLANRMRDKGCTWLRISAKSKNRAAISAYLRFGFDPYEITFTKAL